MFKVKNITIMKDYMEKEFSNNSKNGIVYFQGKYHLNASQFAKLCLQHVHCVIFSDISKNVWIYNFKKGIYEQDSYRIRKLIFYFLNKIAKDAWNSRHIKEVFDMILLYSSEVTQLDKFNNNLIAFENCAFDTKSSVIIPHRFDNYLINSLPVKYIANEECPLFIRFLYSIFEDSKTVEFVKEFFGYCLSNETRAHKLLLNYGTGSNGKSTLFKILQSIIGKDNVSSSSFRDMATDFGLEPLLAKKCNISNESGSDFLNSELLKSISSGDSVTVNRKNKEAIRQILPIKLIFIVNQLPLIKDESYGFERRVIILPFTKTFTASDIDVHLEEKLLLERSGILNFALEGLKSLKDRGYRFQESESMLIAKKNYFGSSAPVKRFLKEKLEMKKGSKIEKNDLRQAFVSWCDENNIDSRGFGSPRKFAKGMQEAYFSEHGHELQEVKHSHTRYYASISYKNII
ncbi:hypothetical protein K2V03_002135 [Listeria innocua]|nr:hypothetical protein [Listeria innocua]EIU0523725.1 hypothetical protein [Listeria innocua]